MRELYTGSTEPKSTNVIWIRDGVPLYYTKGKWTKFHTSVSLNENGGITEDADGLKLNTLAPLGGSVSSFPVHIDNNVPKVALTQATATSWGLVKLFSDVIQNIDANEVSDTADRTYGVQKDSENRLVVNVPWVNTKYNVATVNANGLFSKENVAKLNAFSSIFSTGGDLAKVRDILIGLREDEVVAGNKTYRAVLGVATDAQDGIMTKEDKSKLDGLSSMSVVQTFTLENVDKFAILTEDNVPCEVTILHGIGGDYNNIYAFGKLYLYSGRHTGNVHNVLVQKISSTSTGRGPIIKYCDWPSGIRRVEGDNRAFPFEVSANGTTHIQIIGSGYEKLLYDDTLPNILDKVALFTIGNYLTV